MTGEPKDRPLIDFTIEDTTVYVRDSLEEQSLQVCTAEEPAIQSALTELFIFPVDRAVTVTAKELRIYPVSDAAIRAEDGTNLGQFTTDKRTFSKGTYFIEISGVVKMYIRISDATFSINYPSLESNSAPLEVSLESKTSITIGARSLHSFPQETITVPDEPTALMEAVSYLGSSIKEFSCERSWPSIRGHPPALEPGDSLEIPSALKRPETGLTITVPPTYEDIYRIAPLAFYLGANVKTGTQPALHLTNGYTEPLLSSTESFEEAANRVLRTCLFLDSLTRIGGYYTCSRIEYRELASELPFYPPNLYDASLSEQLMEYFEVPIALLEPYFPKWPLSVAIPPSVSSVSLIPHLCNRLSRIRINEGDAPLCDSSTTVSTQVNTVPQNENNCPLHQSFENAFDSARSAPGKTQSVFITSCERGDLLREWLTSNNSRAVVDAGAVDITVEPTKEELKRIVSQRYDLLYCDLQVTDSGISCVDGIVDFGKSDSIGASVFCLHGPDASDVGQKFVYRGGISGVITERPLSVPHATRFAGYLHGGHSVVESTRLAELDRTTQYRFVGDPTYVMTNGGLGPIRLDVKSVGLDQHKVATHFQPTSESMIGMIARVDDTASLGAYQLCGSKVEQPRNYTTSEIVSLLRDDFYVVRLNGRTYHGESEPSESLVRDSARRALSTVQ